MFEKVKAALRITADVFDDEIKSIISAAFADLRKISGVVFDDDGDDPLIIRAVILYAKSNFGYREDTERFEKAYEHLKIALMLSSDYGGEVNDTV
jgi:hypothetical protein